MNKEIEYVERNLDFYFENNFSQTITDGDFDKREVDTWVSLTSLFLLSLDSEDYNDSEKKEILWLLEDMYSAAEVEIVTGGDVSDIDLDDIGYGYDITPKKYEKIISNAYKVLCDKGINLGMAD